MLCTRGLLLVLFLSAEIAYWHIRWDSLVATIALASGSEEATGNSMHEYYLELGNRHYENFRYEDAMTEYKNALVLEPEYLPAVMNLGNLYREIGLLSESINELEKAYNINPEYYKTSYNLGTTYYHMNDYAKAIEYYTNALKLEPNHVNSHYNLAIIHQETGQLMEALHGYRTALTIDPFHTESRLNYCNILLAINDEQCELCYKQVLSIDPNYVKGIINLASYYQQQSPNGQVSTQALELYQRAYELDKTNIMAVTALQTLQRQQPTTSLDSRYITELFDSYSYIFETSLVANLNYQSHFHVVVAIEKYWEKKEKEEVIHMADLGAGTGLVCPLIKEKLNNLYIVGVDLSSKMLQQAKGKNCYDDLVVDDIDSYLTHREPEPIKFDIIAATDVFVYFGSLENALINARNRLKSNGIIVFTVEEFAGTDVSYTGTDITGTDVSFTLQTTGRFAHRKDYIEDVVNHLNLNLVALDKVVLRMDRGEPINGLLVACKI